MNRQMTCGTSSISFQNPVFVQSCASVVSRKEGEGPLGAYFDTICEDPMFGTDTWEAAESTLQKQAALLAIKKNGLTCSDIQLLFAGDLLAQTSASSFGTADLKIPFYGLFGACSTMGESLSLGSMCIDSSDGKDVFCIQLEKKVYYEKEPAGKALLGLLGLALNSEKPVPIGYFKGMELQIQHLPFGNEYHARLAGSGTYSTQLGADVLGNLTRLSNLANGIEPSIEKTRNMQIQLEQQLASAEEEVKRPFPQATELTEKSKRLAVLEGLLNMNDKDIVTDTEPEQQCQTDNRQRGQEER